MVEMQQRWWFTTSSSQEFLTLTACMFFPAKGLRRLWSLAERMLRRLFIMSPEREIPQRGELSPQAQAENHLLARAQSGEEEAFAKLFDLYKRRVYSLCLRMAGDTAEAEDLAQEAFLQLFRKISTFRGESAFSTWLHRLVVNVVLMHLRKKRLQNVSLEHVDQTREQPLKREYADHDHRLLNSVDRIALRRAIETLPAHYRTVFILHDVVGYEHHEIAQMMKCSVGTSKSYLHRAKLTLRAALRLPQNRASRPVAVAAGYAL